MKPKHQERCVLDARLWIRAGYGGSCGERKTNAAGNLLSPKDILLLQRLAKNIKQSPCKRVHKQTHIFVGTIPWFLGENPKPNNDNFNPYPGLTLIVSYQIKSKTFGVFSFFIFIKFPLVVLTTSKWHTHTYTHFGLPLYSASNPSNTWVEEGQRRHSVMHMHTVKSPMVVILDKMGWLCGDNLGWVWKLS